MKMNMLKFVVAFFLITFSSFTSTVSAEGEISSDPNCFDYYKFGSVIVNISTPRNLYPAGAELSLSGNIENTNPYAIVDGAVLAKIYRINQDKEILDTVDFFVAKNNTALPASSTVQFDFNWQIPKSLVAGDYKLVTYFTTSKKFNLQGLSFTDDISGNEVYFSVGNTKEGGLFFDRSKVYLNKEVYNFSSFSPVVKDDGQPVNLRTTILNTTEDIKEGKVYYDVYKWDSLSEDNFVTTLSSNFLVQPNEAISVSKDLSFFNFPVYFVIVRIEDGDTKSMLGIRYILEDKKHYRLNFPSLTQFPIPKGAEATFFACYHGMGMNNKSSGHLPEKSFEGFYSEPELKDVKINVAFADKSGNEIESFSLNSVIDENMRVLLKKFNTNENIDYLNMKVDMLVDGELYDSVVVEYDCNKFNQAICLNTKSNYLTNPFSGAVEGFTGK